MTENPYASPATNEPALTQRAGVRPWVAVLAGLAIDFAGTIAISIGVSIAAAIYLATRGVGPGTMEGRLTEMLTTGVWSYVLSALGLLVSVLAGYVAARMVKRNELRTGVIQGAIATLLGSLAVGSSNNVPLFILLMLVSFAAVVSGAALGARHNRAVQATAQQIGGQDVDTRGA